MDFSSTKSLPTCISRVLCSRSENISIWSWLQYFATFKTGLTECLKIFVFAYLNPFLEKLNPDVMRFSVGGTRLELHVLCGSQRISHLRAIGGEEAKPEEGGVRKTHKHIDCYFDARVTCQAATISCRKTISCSGQAESNQCQHSTMSAIASALKSFTGAEAIVNHSVLGTGFLSL